MAEANGTRAAHCRSEPRRDACEHRLTEDVVYGREGAAGVGVGADGVADEWRLFVEQVLDADAEGVRVIDRDAQRLVEVRNWPDP